MPTLCVTGCSYSDRTRSTHCYGDFLSTYIDWDYLHLAGGCGSNPRSFRLVTEALINEQLTSGDTVIFQVTDTSRRELMSNWLTYSTEGKQYLDKSKADFAEIKNALSRKVSPQSPVADTNPHYDLVADEVYVTRFKMGSHGWQQGRPDQRFHELTEFYAVNDHLDSYHLYLEMWKLAKILEQKNIKLVVFWMYQDQKKECLGKWFSDFDNVVPHQFVLEDHWNLYRGTHWFSTTNVYALDPEKKDWAHFSVHGHIVIAEILQKYLEIPNA